LFAPPVLCCDLSCSLTDIAFVTVAFVSRARMPTEVTYSLSGEKVATRLAHSLVQLRRPWNGEHSARLLFGLGERYPHGHLLEGTNRSATFNIVDVALFEKVLESVGKTVTSLKDEFQKHSSEKRALKNTFLEKVPKPLAVFLSYGYWIKRTGAVDCEPLMERLASSSRDYLKFVLLILRHTRKLKDPFTVIYLLRSLTSALPAIPSVRLDERVDMDDFFQPLGEDASIYLHLMEICNDWVNEDRLVMRDSEEGIEGTAW
ncbi:unnamed protein product, partial [Cyprideis torosa]